MTNQELDKWIAENVMGWEYAPTKETWTDKAESAYWWKDNNGNVHFKCYASVWHPTESTSDAMMIVEKMFKDNWEFTLELMHNYEWYAKFRKFERNGNMIQLSTEFPVGSSLNKKCELAICLAAKRAIEGEQHDSDFEIDK